MKLSQIASKPQLIKLIIDDEDTIKEFNEAIEFWTWDRQPLDTFMELATVTNKDTKEMIKIVRTLILDESGAPILSNDNMLPTHILMKVISKVVEILGK